jgi:hypothetical protein
MYEAQISRANPTCFLFLLDQTGSMQLRFGAARQSKAQALAGAVNRMLMDLVIRATKGDGLRDYFHCGLLGFGRADQVIGPAWDGPLAGRALVPVSEIGSKPLRVSASSEAGTASTEPTGTSAPRLPVWIDPRAELGQPAPGHHDLIMRACELSLSLLRPWVREHPTSFPPTVVLVTDGGEEGGEPISAARELRGLTTEDGGVLLYCCHISSADSTPLLFPAEISGVPDPYAHMLFEMASPLPAAIRRGSDSGLVLAESARGFAFNADITGLTRFLDIGTRPSALASPGLGR